MRAAPGAAGETARLRQTAALKPADKGRGRGCRVDTRARWQLGLLARDFMLSRGWGMSLRNKPKGPKWSRDSILSTPNPQRHLRWGTRIVLRGHSGHAGARLSALRPEMRKEIQLVANSQGDQDDLEPASTSNAYRTGRQPTGLPRVSASGTSGPCLFCLVLLPLTDAATLSRKGTTR